MQKTTMLRTFFIKSIPSSDKRLFMNFGFRSIFDPFFDVFLGLRKSIFIPWKAPASILNAPLNDFFQLFLPLFRYKIKYFRLNFYYRWILRDTIYRIKTWTFWRLNFYPSFRYKKDDYKNELLILTTFYSWFHSKFE